MEKRAGELAAVFHSLTHFKLVAAHSHFVRPADEDYLVARWALVNAFNPTFFWHAAQAVEKYLKACLLANEVSTIKFGHELNKLFDKYQEIYGEIAVKCLAKPDFFPENFWGDDGAKGFVLRLHDLGHTDSRYGLTGWNSKNSDLFKFDLLCAGLRRHTVGLDWIVGDDWPGDFPAHAKGTWTFRRLLKEEPSYSPVGPLKNLDWPLFDQCNTRRALLHRWNFGFERFESDRRRSFPPTVINRNIIPPFENAFLPLVWESLSKDPFWHDPEAHIYVDGMKWLLPKIKLGKEDSDMLKARLKELEASRPSSCAHPG